MDIRIEHSGQRPRLVWAALGILATVAGMAAGHLVAALLTPASSPVLAVGSTVIDRTPTPVKEWAVREFGTKDKVILVGSVLIGTVLLAALAGIVARNHRRIGLGSIVGLVALAGAAALTRPLAESRDVLPAVAAGVVGVATLAWLGRLAERPARLPEPPAGHPMAASRTTSRRTLLGAAGAVTLLAGLTGWAGVRIERVRTRLGDIMLPAPADPAPALPVGLERVFSGISDFQTPTDSFYRVDVNLTLPIVPVDEWDLRIDGAVDHPFTLTFDELAAMPLIERDITLTCVSNEVGGRYVGGARWLGVPLSVLLDRAGVRGSADQILSTAADGFTISTPLEIALDGRDAMVAIGMNGAALPAEHGFPARLVTPGLYGYVGATKWLRRMTLTSYADETAYWTERGWATQGPIKVASRIDTPKPLATIGAGRTPIGGVAWAQHHGVKGVEIRIDGGPWEPARMGPDAGVDYWRQWYFLWDAEPGRHSLAVRATTEDGEVQTAVRATPFPNGSSGIQEIQVVVE